MYLQHQLILFYPQNYFFIPSPSIHEIQTLQPMSGVSEKQKEEQSQTGGINKLKIYYQVYHQQITKLRENNIKKIWTTEEDEFLLKLNSNSIDWNQISKNIPNTNPPICKRRYFRLKQQLLKWPKELDSLIIDLIEHQKLPWTEIKKIVNDKCSGLFNLPNFTTNKIKERYLLYLRPGISKDQWNIEQDMEIIKVIKQNGKEWTKALKNNKVLQNRTELQLKNRYYGTLKFMQKKVLRKVMSILKFQRNK